MQTTTAASPPRIGTSGWVYKHWRGLFYPEGLRPDREFGFYAERFDTVEINYTYYHLPERSVFEGWREQAPPGFLYAVKASRYLTHMKKLKDPEEPLTRLMERAEGLGDRLGPILFQLHWRWGVNVERLRAFVELLGRYPDHRFTFEFRNASWLTPEVYGILERAGMALCLPVHPHMPVDIRLTAPWTYLRFHGGNHGIGYTEGELAWWADRIREFQSQGAEVFAYFNNDLEGHAIRDAPRLREMLDEGSGMRAAA